MAPEDEIRIDDYCRLANREELLPVFVLLDVEPSRALKALQVLWEVRESERVNAPAFEDCD